ncbi:hypothetical protein [Amycolatopsis thailandensis]|uniref:hypothetical protein n=1 Tax=Amycolatopsis thailandensis TaxID=589330 RepID=UPI003632AB2F
MAEKFFLDPGGLAEATGRLRALGDRLDQAHRRLADTLHHHDGCWGEDEIGKAFSKNYVPAAANTLEGVREAGPALGAFAGTADKASENFSRVDRDTAARMDASVGDGG